MTVQARISIACYHINKHWLKNSHLLTKHQNFTYAFINYSAQFLHFSALPHLRPRSISALSVARAEHLQYTVTLPLIKYLPMATVEQVQRNLDNDTANFRAQHSALALTQISRPKNTNRAYTRVVKEWKVTPLLKFTLIRLCGFF